MIDAANKPRTDRGRIVLLLLVLSLFTNAFLFVKLNEPQKEEVTYRLVKPLESQIDSNTQETEFILHYTGLKNTIMKNIEDFNAVNKTGIFLQDIRTGAWLGINEREEVIPGSLLKVPIMMAVLKKVERGELSLTDKIEILQADLEPFGSLYEKGAGIQLTVWELIKEMILASDNTAKNALKRQLSEAELNSIFAHVGIPNPYRVNSTVTPRGYTRILKSLYFSTYLSPALSEKALEIATDTEQESLLSAGVPPEIQVAHKYGERPDGLHDCGIIYHPENPYFLCIVTKDLERQEAAKLIVRISRDVFEFVDKQ